MKKLTPPQQKVIDIMKSHDCYIHKSQYYNHNKIVSVKPFYDEVNHYEHSCLEQFTRPTFKVLLRLGLIVEFEKDKYRLA